MRGPRIFLYSVLMMVSWTASGCEGGPQPSVSQSRPPGLGATDSAYVGTFPFTYSLLNDPCGVGTTYLPTELQITGVAPGKYFNPITDNLETITLLSGFIIGGLFDGYPLTTASGLGNGSQLNRQFFGSFESLLPYAFIDSNGTIEINALYGNGHFGLAGAFRTERVRRCADLVRAGPGAQRGPVF